jgi:L-fuconolactonase
MKVDSHQHFWRYDPARFGWFDDRMAMLKRDFMPSDLEPLLREHGFDGCVAVQASQTEQETEFLLGLARENSFIKGVVGWVALCDRDISRRLEHYSQFPSLCGVRHIVQWERDDEFMQCTDFQNGIAALSRFSLAYDILIFPRHLASALKLAKRFPDQPFVVDHIAKPYIKDRKIDSWRDGIIKLAELPNVCCKVSGMVTEASWPDWRAEDFTPYLDVVFEAFGIDRVMFGSDWPVCLLAGSYAQVLGILENYMKSFSADETGRFLGGNAQRFYGIGE